LPGIDGEDDAVYSGIRPVVREAPAVKIGVAQSHGFTAATCFARIPLWSHWGSLVTLAVLLGIFWAGRKLSGGF